MRVRKAKPRQVREMETCKIPVPWENAFRTDRMPRVSFLGAGLLSASSVPPSARPPARQRGAAVWRRS